MRGTPGAPAPPPDAEGPRPTPRAPRRGLPAATAATTAAATAAAAGALAVLLAACADGEPRAVATDALPDTVRIAEPGLHPEGVEWDAERGRFLVSSVTTGRITVVEDDGTLRPFVEDPEVAGSIGIHIDGENGRLLVASSDVDVFRDPSAPGRAELGVYDLASGERLHLLDLAALRPEGRHFANDMTATPDGTVYLTDTLSPVVYRVAPSGEVSVLVDDPRLAGDEGIALNGIDWHPDGYLLAAAVGRRTLVRIPPEAPEELAEVELPEPLAADGLVLGPDGTLVAVATTFDPDGESRSEVLWMRSADGWRSAEIVGRAPAGGATTAALRDGEVYVVNPHFEAMGGPEPHPSFELYRVGPEGGR